jgi:hypothetical protein
MDGRLSKVSFTCASAGAAPADSKMAIANAHVNATRGGLLVIDRRSHKQTVVAQPLEHRSRTQAPYRYNLLMSIDGSREKSAACGQRVAASCSIRLDGVSTWSPARSRRSDCEQIPGSPGLGVSRR